LGVFTRFTHPTAGDVAPGNVGGDPIDVEAVEAGAAVSALPDDGRPRPGVRVDLRGEAPEEPTRPAAAKAPTSAEPAWRVGFCTMFRISPSLILGSGLE
jgi:hypothetical protein